MLKRVEGLPDWAKRRMPCSANRVVERRGSLQQPGRNPTAMIPGCVAEGSLNLQKCQVDVSKFPRQALPVVQFFEILSINRHDLKLT